MAIIQLITRINAPIEKCFDLSRSIELHMLSTSRTGEKAIAGRTSGLCELNDEITWEARHFGIRQRLSVKITKMNRPAEFEDVMLKGAFRSMRHVHSFREENGHTVMLDDFRYEVPLGFIGRLFDVLVLKAYMTRFLLERNSMIREMAEKEKTV